MNQILIFSGSSWNVPADWNSADNNIETIGGGGGGTSSGGDDAGGGGGGGYSKITNLSLSPGATVTYRVGGGGAPNTAGGDTWFNGANLAASSVGAKGGGANSGITGGQSGQASSGIGTTKFSGGDGGTSNNSNNGGAGGGGAGGPNGDGQAGGPSAHNSGSGGGGAGGGSATVGSDGNGLDGGQGGTAQDGTAGGAGAVSGGAAAVAGSHGSGGGGGALDSVASTPPGAPGGAGIEFDSTHGAGGGGGGGGYHGMFGIGGDGGLYGGGGGGSSFLGPSGGAGGQGVIVITYTPTTSNSITVDASIPLDLPATAYRNDLDPIQFLSSTRRDAELPTETSRVLRHSILIPIELTGLVRGPSVVDTEWSGALAVTNDALSRMEWLGGLRSEGAGATEFSHRISQDINNPAEWPALSRVDQGADLEHAAALVANSCFVSEYAGRVANGPGLRVEGLCSLTSDASLPPAVLAVFGRDTLLGLESLTSGVLIFASELLFLEWADPPDLRAVSTNRLLRSPGRTRILAGSGSKHPTRSQ